MKTNELNVADRLEAAATLLERTLAWLEERRVMLSGEVEKISATVEQSRREEELAEKLVVAEREIAEIKAAAVAQAAAGAQVAELDNASAALRAGAEGKPVLTSVLRRTAPAAASEMLSKQTLSDGEVNVSRLDAALAGLSLEQRIAVKSQLLKAGI